MDYKFSRLVTFSGADERDPERAASEATKAYGAWRRYQGDAIAVTAITPTAAAAAVHESGAPPIVMHTYTLLVQYDIFDPDDVTPDDEEAMAPTSGTVETFALHRTERGFVFADFTDHNGRACSIQNSSVATEPCLWLGLDNLDTAQGGGRMHLDQATVTRLLPHLMAFIENGTIDPATLDLSDH